MPKPPPTISQQIAIGKGNWGGAYDPPRDPLSKSSKVEAAGAFYRDVPITALTGPWSISGIRAALQDHRAGLWRSPAQLCESIFGDDRVQATLGSRTGGLFSQPLKHERRGKGKRFSHRAHRAWVEMWPRVFTQAATSEMMRWAIGLGFSINEIRWDTTKPLWEPTLRPFNATHMNYRWDLRQYQISTLDGPVAAIPSTGKWLLYTPHGAYRGWIQGAVRAIAEPWFIKRLGWRDWARFNERHGLPIIKAQIPAAGDPLQKTQFVQSMRTLGQEAVIALPMNVDGTKYDASLLEARDRSWESFPNLIDRCDRSIVLPILWQNLTTEVKEGSYAAARVHGDVRQNAIEFDNETLSEAIYEQVARPWAFFNFGDPDVAPYSHWDVQPIEDFVAKTEILYKFSQAMQQLRQAGMAPHNARALARRFGFDIGHIDEVEPVQVEAKAAGVTGKSEAPSSLRAALRDTRRLIRKLDKMVMAA